MKYSHGNLSVATSDRPKQRVIQFSDGKQFDSKLHSLDLRTTKINDKNAKREMKASLPKYFGTFSHVKNFARLAISP